MKISVTKKDIQNGIRFEGEACPIALATYRKLKPNHISVEDNEIIFYLEDDVINFNLPVKAQEFIENFDDGNKVKPFTFTIPDKVIKQVKGK
jgi:hypothetical protein